MPRMLLDFMEVDRAIGKFSIIAPDDEHEKFLRRLDDYFEKVDVQP